MRKVIPLQFVNNLATSYSWYSTTGANQLFDICTCWVTLPKISSESRLLSLPAVIITIMPFFLFFNRRRSQFAALRRWNWKDVLDCRPSRHPIEGYAITLLVQTSIRAPRTQKRRQSCWESRALKRSLFQALSRSGYSITRFADCQKLYHSIRAFPVHSTSRPFPILVKPKLWCVLNRDSDFHLWF